jgi:simple sugar transport system permease protein
VTGPAASSTRKPADGNGNGGRAAAAGALIGRIVALSLVPVASIVLALAVGAILIAISSVVGPNQRFDLALPLVAYRSLLEGAIGSETGLINTIVQSSPLILTGLAVGIGFKAGLFNIGATGQVYVGGFTAALVGVAVGTGENALPSFLAVPIAIAAGALGGAIYGAIPGALKAFTGAHEVVTTIMFNFLAQLTISGLINDVFRAPGYSFARTADVGTAAMPLLIGRLHLGVIISILIVPVIYWLIWRTTLGFEIRTVGANPTAASYAGMRPRRIIVLTMAICGLCAGLAGVLEILNFGGYPAVYGTRIGFDGITVALLGRAHPVGILLSAFLLGAMRAGAPLMQINADVPVEIIDVIQAVILLFLAAEIVVRRLFRIRAARGGIEDVGAFTRSYGERVA